MARKKDEAAVPNEQATGAGAGALRERVEQRAYELYEQRGCVDGFATQDWLQAEREIVGPAGRVEASTDDKGAR